MEYIALFFLSALLIYFIVSGQRAWRASIFYLIFGHVDGADNSYLIKPSPMIGSATLRVDAFNLEKIPKKNWEKAQKSTRLFFWGKKQDDFFVLDSNFTIQVKNVLSGEPLLTGTFLPSWNLKGTNRDRVIFPKALKLDSGVIYRIFLLGKERNKSVGFFKIEERNIYTSRDVSLTK